MLHRQGNKSKLANQIISLFPEHDRYIEPFFGTGSIFFAKPLVKYNLLNDIDEDVFNFHQQVKLNPELFRATLETAIIHEKIIKSFKADPPTDPIERAVLFLLSSNNTWMSDGRSMKVEASNSREIALSRISLVSMKLTNALFTAKDWRKFLDSISARTLNKKTSFCYVDPPYLGTRSYRFNFIEQDVVSLLDKLEEKKLRFAYSEFDHPFILAEAGRRGLTIHTLRERKNIENRRTEILLTNYPVSLPTCGENQLALLLT